jgi:RiboL-PSP-HEPN
VPDWTDQATDSHSSIAASLAVVDNLLGFAKDGKGKPSVKERALFAAAVVFTYGIWENFVEQLAIELATRVAKVVAPEKVPEQIRKLLEKRSAWELTVTPGWRKLWMEHVRLQAIGDDEDKFGMNTAKAGQVKHLLSLAGVDDPYQGIAVANLPDHLPQAKKTVVEAINSLVELRGAIVHTGKVPDTLRKSHVLAWRLFVETATNTIDASCRAQCKKNFA